MLRGRSLEMSAALGALVTAVAQGEGAVVVISGEAGIGKTALLEAVREQAVRRGFAVGYGKADEVNQVAAGAPVLLALRSGNSPLVGNASFRRLAAQYDRPLWLVEEISDLLEDRAQRAPVLIVLDDLQWADMLSWFAVRVLTSRLAGSPVVWLLATRDDEQLTRARLQSTEGLDGVNARYLPLGPLTPQDVAAVATDILGTSPTAGAVERLSQAGGNPFLVVQLAEGFAATGQDDGGFPGPLAATLRARLVALGSVGIALIRMAAVWGRPLSIPTAAKLVGVTPATVSVVQAGAVAGGLLAASHLLEFRHDLVREFLYDDLDTTDLLLFHRRCLDMLAETAASIADSVPHAQALAPSGDAAAIGVLRRAAQECGPSMPRIAASLAMEAFHGVARDDSLRLELAEEAAEFLTRAQRGTEAIAVVDDMVPLAVSADARARLTVLAARALWLTDEPGNALDRIDAALALPGVGAVLNCRLSAWRALAMTRIGTAESAALTADRALLAARQLDDRTAEIIAREALGELAKNDGRHIDAYAQFHQLRLLAGSRYLANEITSLQFIDRFDHAQALLSEASEGLDEQSAATLPSLIGAQLWQDFKTAHWDEALADAQTLVRVGDELGSYMHRIDARVVESAVAVVRGNLEAAEKALARAEQEQTAGDTAQLAGLLLTRARIHVARGELSQAAGVLKPLLQSGDTAGTYWPRLVDQARLGAGVAMATGDKEFMQDSVTQAISAARRNPGVASLEATALQVEGYVNDDPELLAAAVEMMRPLPRPFVLASALFDHSNALSRRGATDRARATMEEAWTIFVRIEAKQPAEQAEQALVRMGRRRRHSSLAAHRPATGWGSLTDAEIRVARLITAGHTNRSTARELGVSIHTVSTHLRSVFTKMDVRSRVQLTNQVRALDSVGE